MWISYARRIHFGCFAVVCFLLGATDSARAQAEPTEPEEAAAPPAPAAEPAPGEPDAQPTAPPIEEPASSEAVAPIEVANESEPAPDTGEQMVVTGTRRSSRTVVDSNVP